MKKFLILIILSGLFVRCSNPTTVKNKDENMSIKTFDDNVIYPPLLNELENIIVYIDSLSNKNRIKNNIFIIYFYKKNDNCYLTISSANFYDKTRLIGYYILKEKMIAFYNVNRECSIGLVDTTKLLINSPVNYDDENSLEAKDIYEPYVRKFKIVNNDSLQIIPVNRSL